MRRLKWNVESRVFSFYVLSWCIKRRSFVGEKKIKHTFLAWFEPEPSIITCVPYHYSSGTHPETFCTYLYLINISRFDRNLKNEKTEPFRRLEPVTWSSNTHVITTQATYILRLYLTIIIYIVHIIIIIIVVISVFGLFFLSPKVF